MLVVTVRREVAENVLRELGTLLSNTNGWELEFDVDGNIVVISPPVYSDPTRWATVLIPDEVQNKVGVAINNLIKDRFA